MNILIYQDYANTGGRLNNGFLYAMLVDTYGRSAVGYCDADDIVDGILTRNVDMFIIPGGADLYFCEKLNGAGNANIRDYVESGGSYLGICAGAYYACAAIDWANGTDQAIAGPRELNFYNGVAFGPVTTFLEDGDINRSWFSAVPLIYNDGIEKISCFVAYEAGPVFLSAGPAKILASYEDGSAAIVECIVGQGRVILSSPHIECVMPKAMRQLYRHNNDSHDYERDAFAKLASYQFEQKKIWLSLLNRLLTRQDAQSDAA